jgi:acetyl esterase/lipase
MARPPAAPVVRYGSHPDQVANLHLPAGEPPFPVVVLLHGGFWRDRWDRTLMTPLADDLARRGYAAWNVEYRRVGQEGGGWPGMGDDVVAALNALARERSVDATRVVLVGHSAGGHLGLWAATRAVRPQIAGVIALAPLSDLTWTYALDAGAVEALLGGSPEAVPDAYAAASPSALLPLGMAQVLVHGSADDVVPPRMSEEYAASARSAGDSVELHVLPGADHFDVIDPDHAAWAVVLGRIERLLS